MERNNSIYIAELTEANLIAKLNEKGGMSTSQLYRYLMKEIRPSSFNKFLEVIYKMKSFQYTVVLGSQILFISVNTTKQYIPISENRITKLMLVAEWELKKQYPALWYERKMKMSRIYELLGADKPRDETELYGVVHTWFPGDASIREFLFPEKELSKAEYRILFKDFLEKYPQEFKKLNKRMRKIEYLEACKNSPKEGNK